MLLLLTQSFSSVDATFTQKLPTFWESASPGPSNGASRHERRSKCAWPDGTLDPSSGRRQSTRAWSISCPSPSDPLHGTQKQRKTLSKLLFAHARNDDTKKTKETTKKVKGGFVGVCFFFIFSSCYLFFLGRGIDWGGEPSRETSGALYSKGRTFVQSAHEFRFLVGTNGQ